MDLMKSIMENQLRKFLIMQKIYLKYENEPGVKVKLERVNGGDKTFGKLFTIAIKFDIIKK